MENLILEVNTSVEVCSGPGAEMALARSASYAAAASRESVDLEGDSAVMLRCINLLRMFPAHVSPFRQHKIQLEIVTDRAVSAEFFRHKYVEGEGFDFEAVERSSRYVNFKDGLPMLAPTVSVVGGYHGDLNVLFNDTMELYSDVSKHVGRDMARRLLPLGLATRLVVANSLEGWARFYLRRHDPKYVDPLMVELANHLFAAMDAAFPTLWREMLGAAARPDVAYALRVVSQSLEGEEQIAIANKILACMCLTYEGRLKGIPWSN